MRKFFRRLAAAVVTYYCDRIYRKAVKAADERHEKEHEMFYVVDHLIKGQTLTVINRRMFRKMKMDAQRWTNPMYEIYFDKEYNLQVGITRQTGPKRMRFPRETRRFADLLSSAWGSSARNYCSELGFPLTFTYL